MAFVRTSLFGFAALALVACGGEDSSSGDPDLDGSGSGGGASSGAGGSSGGAAGGEGSSGGVVPTGSCVVKADVRESTTWSPSACPDGYLVKFETQVTGSGVVLTIEPGTVVKHEGSGMLIVEDGAALVAQGTESAKIRFTSLHGAPASYRGLRITSDNPASTIAHAVIEHAGSSDKTRAALTLAQGGGASGRLALSDTEIVDNGRVGLTLLGDAKLTKFERVALQRNAGGAAHVDAPLVPQLRGLGNTFEGVTFVEVTSLKKVTEDAVWPSVAPAVYRLVGQNGSGGDVLKVEKHLESEPGAVVEMAPGSGILVAGSAAGLKAVGTPDQKIVFRGVAGAGWQGITFGATAWPDNRLENVEIHNATKAPSWGYYGTGSASVRAAGVLLGYISAAPVQLTVKDFTVAGPNEAPADIAVKSGTTLVQQGALSGTGQNGSLDIESF